MKYDSTGNKNLNFRNCRLWIDLRDYLWVLNYLFTIWNLYDRSPQRFHTLTKPPLKFLLCKSIKKKTVQTFGTGHRPRRPIQRTSSTFHLSLQNLCAWKLRNRQIWWQMAGWKSNCNNSNHESTNIIKYISKQQKPIRLSTFDTQKSKIYIIIIQKKLHKIKQDIESTHCEC